MTDDPAHDEPAYPGVPRWVKLSAIVLLVLAAIAVLVMLVAGSEHGPGRHGSFGHATDSFAASPALP